MENHEEREELEPRLQGKGSRIGEYGDDNEIERHLGKERARVRGLVEAR